MDSVNKGSNHFSLEQHTQPTDSQPKVVNAIKVVFATIGVLAALSTISQMVWDGHNVTPAQGTRSVIPRADLMHRNKIPGYRTDLLGRIYNPAATGGYKAGIPEKVEFGSVTFTPKDSLWHHLVPDGKGGYEPSQERARLHALIISRETDKIPPSPNPVFYLLGGGPGSGKTTVLNRMGSFTHFPKRDKAVYINADDIKVMLPEYERMSASEDDGDFFHSAEFVHEESSLLAKRMQRVAMHKKQPIVLDGTGDSTPENLKKKVDEVKREKYKVHGLYVTIQTEEACKRAVIRALEQGRFVPRSVIEETHRAVSDTLPKVIQDGNVFDNLTLFDNSAGVRRVVEVNGENCEVLDRNLWREFVEKGQK